MPDYTAVNDRFDSIRDAKYLQDRLQNAYEACQVVKGAVELYQAGTDTDFNAAIDAIFTAAERQELGQMLGNINTMLDAWEADPGKRDLLGI